MKSSSPVSISHRGAGLAALALAVLCPMAFAHDPVTSATKAGDKAADTTAVRLEDYKADRSELSKAEVKASLERLDADIDLLAAKIEAITDPVRKTELTQRLNALKDRRSELNREFRQARYDALKADVKEEWNRLVH